MGTRRYRPIFGIAPGYTWGKLNFLDPQTEPLRIQQDLQLIRKAGAQWIRLGGKPSDFIVRDNIPTSPLRYNPAKFEELRELVGQCNEAGIEPIILIGIDIWKRPTLQTASAATVMLPEPMTPIDDFADFAGRLVEACGNQVSVYELINEPEEYGRTLEQWGGEGGASGIGRGHAREAGRVCLGRL